jgi:hypothetical protein
MPFAILLIPADVEAPPPAYEAAVEASVQANGGHIGPGWVVRLPDGGEFAFGTHDFRLKALSPDVCKVIFDAALRTNTYITNGGGGSDLVPLKVKGSTLEVLSSLGRAEEASNPGALCARLSVRLSHWNSFVRNQRAEGMMDGKEEFLEPPRAPGTEPRLPPDPSGIAARCLASQESLSKVGWKIVRSVVSQNAQFGVVWRADVETPYSQDPMRVVCWKATGRHGRLVVISGPLEMLDPSQTVGQLEAEQTPKPGSLRPAR